MPKPRVKKLTHLSIHEVSGVAAATNLHDGWLLLKSAAGVIRKGISELISGLSGIKNGYLDEDTPSEVLGACDLLLDYLNQLGEGETQKARPPAIEQFLNNLASAKESYLQDAPPEIMAAADLIFDYVKENIIEEEGYMETTTKRTLRDLADEAIKVAAEGLRKSAMPTVSEAAATDAYLHTPEGQWLYSKGYRNVRHKDKEVTAIANSIKKSAAIDEYDQETLATIDLIKEILS